MTPPLSVLLYSHDSQGLGHVKRNLALAHHIAARIAGEAVRGLIVSGLAHNPLFTLPEGFDWLALPGIAKKNGAYVPRRLSGSLSDTLALRSALLESALVAFSPDLVVVDRHPLGVGRELEAPLRALKRSRPQARVVLGLRDILDEPTVAAREWADLGGASILDGLIDQVWIFGDPSIHDATSTGEVPAALASRAIFTGYLADGRTDVDPHPGPIKRPFVLTTVGGGSDGGRIVEAAAGARIPEGHDHLVVAGPQLDDASIERACSLAGPTTTVVRTCPGLAHRIREAAAVISMGGYNTVCEILAADTPALIVPREVPRLEQTIRARALAGAHLIDTLSQADATPEALSRWLNGAVTTRTDRSRIARGGLAAAAHAAMTLIAPDNDGDLQ